MAQGDAGSTRRRGFHIAASAQVMERHPRMLKSGGTFGLFDRHGDIDAPARAAEGLYHDDTRFLSRLVLKLGGARPLLVRSSAAADKGALRIDLTNPDIDRGEELAALRERLLIERRRVLEGPLCRERIEVRNLGAEAIALPLAIEFAADFRDMFQIRGQPRKHDGKRLPASIEADRVMFAFAGADGHRYETLLAFAPTPEHLDAGTARFAVNLGPGEVQRIQIDVRLLSPDIAEEGKAAPRKSPCAIDPAFELTTSHPEFDRWVARSRADLDMLATATPHGLYPYGGIPWYCSAFGRDGIITALFCLWADPGLARGVLAFLAATQARDHDPRRDAEPGKIVHETRKGEMARLGEVPFGQYYGSIDATPLFVILAGAYWRRTGDLELIRRLLPNLKAALDWMDRWGDKDGDGFLEYGGGQSAEGGLTNQGWKDSWDAVFHADGALAEPPIALVEVQAYAFKARRHAARLFEALGEEEAAAEQRAKAEALRRRFEDAFWCEELATYALALDRKKRPCRVRSSNAGHALWAGIATPERGRRVARTLMEPASFAGWGVRTIAEGEARYNPVSYHDGSIWPQDNVIIAEGLARYGAKPAALRIAKGLFAAAVRMDLDRLPELIAGLAREADDEPGHYPIACAVQAWSSASPFALIATALGLGCDAGSGQLRLRAPALLEPLAELTIRNLRLGSGSIDFRVRRETSGFAVETLRREGGVGLIVEE